MSGGRSSCLLQLLSELLQLSGDVVPLTFGFGAPGPLRLQGLLQLLDTSLRDRKHSSDEEEDQNAEQVLPWISPTHLKLFHLLLKLSHQTLFILHFRLKLTQIKVFSVGRYETETE